MSSIAKIVVLSLLMAAGLVVGFCLGRDPGANLYSTLVTLAIVAAGAVIWHLLERE